jgi:hypothetical protein
MRNVLRDRTVRNAGIGGLVILAMTLIGGTRFPWAFVAVWAIWLALTAMAIVSARRKAA